MTDSWSSCLHFLSVELTGVDCHAWLRKVVSKQCTIKETWWNWQGSWRSGVQAVRIPLSIQSLQEWTGQDAYVLREFYYQKRVKPPVVIPSSELDRRPMFCESNTTINETWDGLTSGLCLTQINMAEICHPYENSERLWRMPAPDASKDFCDCTAF